MGTLSGASRRIKKLALSNRDHSLLADETGDWTIPNPEPDFTIDTHIQSQKSKPTSTQLDSGVIVVAHEVMKQSERRGV